MAGADERAVEEVRRENALQGHDTVRMPRRRSRALQVIGIRLRLVGVVVLDASGDSGPIGKVVVDLRDRVSLEADPVSREDELRRVAGNRSVRDREERQIRDDARRDRDRGLGRARVAAGRDAHEAVTGVWRQRIGVVRQALGLVQLFVVGEQERRVLSDRSASRAAELIALEVRPLGVEEIPRVERAVPQEFKRAPVEGIGARFVDRRHHASGGPAIFGGVLVGQDAEFADRLDAEIDVQSAAGARVGEVVHNEAVDEKHIAGGPISGDGQRKAVAACRAGIREARGRLLSDAALDTRLERCELQPIASVQRQLANLSFPHQPTEARIDRVDLRHLRGHGDVLRHSA